MLSRWDGDAALPPAFEEEMRIRCPLAVLWHGERDVRLWPPDAPPMWSPPGIILRYIAPPPLTP